ncbi:MAG: TIGR03986 family CRISPR-associated RAMP protein, partial [Desulfovibrionaceae bacterium]|nr:TIGR03986 family CRISPR-associated RAMP protein [Desulfovibrionaceae bacterium]
KEIFKIGQTGMPQKGGYLVRHGADFEIIPVRFEVVSERSAPNPSKTRVFTGPMQKKTHAYDFDSFRSHERDKGLIVNDKLLDDFLLQLTPAQEKFLRDHYKINGEADIKRNLNIPLPVFYLEKNGEVDFFGLARYFRYPTKYTPIDLRDKTMAPLEPGKHDLSMQLFGYTDKEQSLRGRVSFSPAIFPENTQAQAIGEVVLGQPHHTCFSHYLVQDKQKMRTMKRSRFPRWDINSLNTYNTPSQIRGRKYYWHRDFEKPQVAIANKKFQSLLVPIPTATETECTLNLERLTLIELGAILEALILPEGHAHKLGSGKALGLGSVRFEIKRSDIALCQDLYNDIEKRCFKFFGSSNEESQDQEALFLKAREAFKNWLLDALSKKGQKCQDYKEIPHIASFLHMTDFANKPANSKTALMDLKEFMANRVLSEAKDIK